MPWKRANAHPERAHTIIYVACEIFQMAVLCSWTFMQRTADPLLDAFGAPAPLNKNKDVIFECDLSFPGTPITITSKKGLLTAHDCPQHHQDSQFRKITSLHIVSCSPPCLS
jgi:hypothetical protein